MSTSSVQLTLAAEVSRLPLTGRVLPPGYNVRETQLEDVEELAELYLSAYPREIVADDVAAREEIEVTIKGQYGELDLSLSPSVTQRTRVVAAVLTVKEAPWGDTPPWPFIIEVMVHPDHRRKGLARFAVLETASRLLVQRAGTVGLRVMSDNEAAVKLYNGLGFYRWEQ